MAVINFRIHDNRVNTKNPTIYAINESFKPRILSPIKGWND